MRPLREVLDGKSFGEKLRYMREHPPTLEPGTIFAEDERCPSCGGLVHDNSGTEGTRCRCTNALRRCLERADRADPQGRMTFDRLEQANPSQTRAATGEQRGLALFGPPGTGKTHLAISACRLALARRVAAEYCNVVEVVGRVQETYGGGWCAETRASVIGSVAGRELVVLDDLGMERCSSDVGSIVYELVDAIYCSGTRLIVCSNLGNAAYGHRYDEAVRSRVAGMCEIVGVSGEDKRRALGGRNTPGAPE